VRDAALHGDGVSEERVAEGVVALEGLVAHLAPVGRGTGTACQYMEGMGCEGRWASGR